MTVVSIGGTSLQSRSPSLGAGAAVPIVVGACVPSGADVVGGDTVDAPVDEGAIAASGSAPHPASRSTPIDPASTRRTITTAPRSSPNGISAARRPNAGQTVWGM
jgi:hypothetical protein